MDNRQQQFLKNFPDRQVILEAEPEELAPFLLRYLANAGRSELNRYNCSSNYPKDAVGEHLMEAWMWLEREGFLAPRIGEQGEWVFITRKGRRVLEEEDFEAYRKASIFPAHLDGALIRYVKPLFARGDYDTAVFRAFKEVEVRARKAAKYGNDAWGRDLMTRAFGPTGALTDPSATKGERDAIRELFAGAIAMCKNPSSHREVQFDDPTEALDLICFANQLLRMIARAKSA